MRYRFFRLASFMLAAGSGMAQAAEPRTPLAVIAADRAWGQAEIDGNAAFVERLLLPEYRSISGAGAITTKQQIVDSTRARGASLEYAAKVAAWKEQHPSEPMVAFSGRTATEHGAA